MLISLPLPAWLCCEEKLIIVHSDNNVVNEGNSDKKKSFWFMQMNHARNYEENISYQWINLSFGTILTLHTIIF